MAEGWVQTNRRVRNCWGWRHSRDSHTAIGFNFRNPTRFSWWRSRKVPLLLWQREGTSLLKYAQRLLQRKGLLEEGYLNFPEPNFNSKNGSMMNSQKKISFGELLVWFWRDLLTTDSLNHGHRCGPMNHAGSIKLEPQAPGIRGLSTGLRMANQGLAQRLIIQSPVERIPLIFLFG